jgi:hypothetical protein
LKNVIVLISTGTGISINISIDICINIMRLVLGTGICMIGMIGIGINSIGIRIGINSIGILIGLHTIGINSVIVNVILVFGISTGKIPRLPWSICSATRNPRNWRLCGVCGLACLCGSHVLV